MRLRFAAGEGVTPPPSGARRRSPTRRGSESCADGLAVGGAAAMLTRRLCFFGRLFGSARCRTVSSRSVLVDLWPLRIDTRFFFPVPEVRAINSLSARNVKVKNDRGAPQHMFQAGACK